MWGWLKNAVGAARETLSKNSFGNKLLIGGDMAVEHSGALLLGAGLIGSGAAVTAVTNPMLRPDYNTQREAIEPQLQASYSMMPEQYEAMQEMQMMSSGGRGVGQRESLKNFMSSTNGLVQGLHKSRHGS